jgi:hypothetical protein
LDSIITIELLTENYRASGQLQTALLKLGYTIGLISIVTILLLLMWGKMWVNGLFKSNTSYWKPVKFNSTGI